MANNDYKTWRKTVALKVPAFAPILYALSYREDDSAGIGTFCVDPFRFEMTYSPKFAANNTTEQNCFILAHEAGHVLCDHGNRRKAMAAREGSVFQFQLWQVAEEMQVNDLVKTLSGWDQPAQSIKCEDKYKGMTTEETYFELKKDAKVIKVSCKCMQGNGDGQDGKDKTPVDAATEMIRQAAVESAQKIAGREPGNECGELKRIAIAGKEFSAPPDMRQLLRKFLIAMDSNCKHFDAATLYKRRQEMDGLCLPNLSSQPIARKFVVSIDNSGSIGDEEFAEFKGILASTAKQLGFQEIVVQHFTTEVMKTERYFDLNKLKKIAREANGGTAIEDCDVKAAQHKAQFHIILTDGYVNWLDRYSLPTLIVLTQEVSKPAAAPNMIGALELWRARK